MTQILLKEGYFITILSSGFRLENVKGFMQPLILTGSQVKSFVSAFGNTDANEFLSNYLIASF